MATSIELAGVGKRYRLGEHHGSGVDMRDRLAGLGARLRGRAAPEIRELWSLRDVTFSVEEGQALGVVGANGAGKSTLLKVISRVTAPTTGVSRTRGRVGSLLEVGTGFHPELTGFENAYLNGAILGMRRKEVTRQLDAIVEFAGLERFMDTPVKRYSSGMYLRLGFAIAAHLAADILLVDEVLAVGDAEFQRRCLGKMSEVERSGRTVLFVSHNLEAMARLCATSIWLEAGQIRAMGPTHDIIRQYLGSSTRTAATNALEVDATAPAQIAAVSIVDCDGQPVERATMSEAPEVRIDVVVNQPIPGLDVSFALTTTSGTTVLLEALSDTSAFDLGRPGRHRLRCALPPILTPGDFVLDVFLGTAYEQIDVRERVGRISIEGVDHDRANRLLKLDLPWSVDAGEPGT